MTLEEAQALGIANSPSTRTALAAVRVARGALMQQAGVFDPLMTAEGSRLSADSPVTSPFAASKLRQRSLSSGMSWLSPIGTSVAFTLSRVTTESNAPFSTLPRERRTRAHVDFVQPLLKGFGLAATRGDLRAAQRDLEAAMARRQAAISDLDAAVEVAYWDLYAAERDLSSERLQRQRAAIFLRNQTLRARAGAAGPGAVAAARTFLADQEVQLLDARIRLQAASDALRETMGISPMDERRVHAASEPPAPRSIEPLTAVLERARRNNPALHAYERDAAAAQARYRRATWNAWPSVEAFGGYGGSGLAGTGQVVDFGGTQVGSNFDTGYGPAWNDVWSDKNPDWNFGLRLRMPIGWRADRGQREVQRGNLERTRETLRAQTLGLESSVRQAHREAVLSQDALRAMHELVDAAREQARIGRLEYQAGRTTAYDLVGIEADLARAELRESQVLVRVARSLVELDRLTRLSVEAPR
jgi:outer membrane protein TolC